MSQGKSNFRHESLQDARSIQDILKAITKGIARGKVTLGDDDGEIVLEPEGLLHLKVTARKDEARHRIDLRITWQVEAEVQESGALRVSG